MPEPIFQIVAYGALMGLFHLAFVTAALVLALPWLFISKRKYGIFARGFTAFNALLWLCGTATNFLWGTFVFGRLYTSTDYVFDFIPFLPITQAHIDRPWANETGHIFHGLNILHIQGLWFLFALATWLAAIYLYSRTRKIWSKNGIEQTPSPDGSAVAGEPSGEACRSTK